MKEWILSRRDQTKVAWHEVPGNKRKSGTRPEGTVDLLTTNEIRPEALSDLWVQDRNPFLGTKDTVDV